MRKYKKPKQTGAEIFNCTFTKTYLDHNKSAILSHKALNKDNVQTLLNDLFPLNKDTNDRTLKEYIVI